MILLNRQDAGGTLIGQRRADNGLPTKLGCPRPASQVGFVAELDESGVTEPAHWSVGRPGHS
ncbi:hypothetical protein [Streptomyces sp. Isolate_45]|uniref:hypothetical protein n=1 Tax=Streptomyces sp. Isolate_45 TaxID=2950111 RepID=UPI002481F2C5|nr:hypothetical protein [Streptomyces sp. Isolate_45]MDA5281067.1 hypothetical protein [Streptomyces sp. Isolate_45]